MATMDEVWHRSVPIYDALKRNNDFVSSSHLNRLLSQINIVPKQTYSQTITYKKHYRTRVKKQ